ncbi:hypothetical protein Pmani_023033 [Petrolisthes manimaculis]|uniref:Uncharacterized protein n=1 Tax=Petrolisthes manimaculis TaxID=1843537 RepID=A0AAE1U0K6_9EUCA|nr:hypothetical protein Pmani_023033 [Petrolisthes manimaculis]
MSVVDGTEGGEMMVLYKAVGEGLCGDDIGTHVTLSVVFCAVWCSQDLKCNGFSYKGESPATTTTSSSSSGSCYLHENITPPDNTTDYVCYQPPTLDSRMC